MEDIEKFGAKIFLAMGVIGSVVYFGTPSLGAGILTPAVVAAVALAFSSIAMWRSDRANAAIGYAASSASLVAASLVNPEAALSSIFLIIFVLGYFIAIAFAVRFVTRDGETLARVFPSILWPIGALKYLNTQFWQFWGRRIQRRAR